MSVVVLIFIGLVIYWSIKESRQAHRASTAFEVPAVPLPVVEPRRTASPAPPSARLAPAAKTELRSDIVPARPASTETEPAPVIVMPPMHTGPEHRSGQATTLSEADRATLWGMPVLAPFTEEERRTLLDDMQYRAYRAGEVVFKEHQEAADLCLLVSGQIGLLTTVGHGKSLVAGVIKPGKLFAWSGLVGSHHFTATAHTMENTVVGFLSREHAQQLIEMNPHLGYHLMEQVAETLAERLADSGIQLAGLAGSG